MRDDPAVLLEGPRSVGKSTLLRPIAETRGGRILDLDDPATLNAVQTDPATMLAEQQLVCIDEYQRAPIVLDVIEADLNTHTAPGRFVLAGSAQHQALPGSSQALAGRLNLLPVLPLAQGEINDVHETWLEVLRQPTSSSVPNARIKRSPHVHYWRKSTAVALQQVSMAMATGFGGGAGRARTDDDQIMSPGL